MLTHGSLPSGVLLGALEVIAWWASEDCTACSQLYLLEREGSPSLMASGSLEHLLLAGAGSGSPGGVTLGP